MAESYFRRFELTIGVFLPHDAPLPITFNDWVLRAFGIEVEGAMATTLERIVEIRLPLADDVLQQRVGKFSPWM